MPLLCYHALENCTSTVLMNTKFLHKIKIRYMDSPVQDLSLGRWVEREVSNCYPRTTAHLFHSRRQQLTEKVHH